MGMLRGSPGGIPSGGNGPDGEKLGGNMLGRLGMPGRPPMLGMLIMFGGMFGGIFCGGMFCGGMFCGMFGGIFMPLPCTLLGWFAFRPGGAIMGCWGPIWGGPC